LGWIYNPLVVSLTLTAGSIFNPVISNDNGVYFLLLKRGCFSFLPSTLPSTEERNTLRNVSDSFITGVLSMKKIAYILTLFLAVTASGDPFGVMVAPTRQDASLDWWYAVPEGFTPKISLVASVAKGEYFNIIPFFKNYGVTSNGEARITYDIEILRPDGSVDDALSGCDGHTGKATPPNLIAARAVLRICFDPEDPYGEYTINVTAYDHISSQTHREIVVIEQTAFSIETLSKSEREELFLRYAESPNPSRALAAFLQTEHSFFGENQEPIWSAIWFFKTVFENNDYLIPHLLEAFSRGTPKQQKDIILILALISRTDELPVLPDSLKTFEQVMKAGRVPDPYSEITTGQQLDMLWAEYFASGRIKPIQQLTTSLNLVKHLGTLDKIKAGELDPEDLEVYRTGMLESVFQSALWSLRSNCEQSPLLFPYCINILDSEALDPRAQHVFGMLLQSIAEEQKGTHEKDH